jgi:hypothetical protein
MIVLKLKNQMLGHFAEVLHRGSVWIRCGLLCLTSLALSLPSAAQTIDLFPGNRLGEWTRVALPPDPLGNIDQWHTDPATREIICDGNGGREWLRYNREFSNFTLHAEWRFTKLAGSPKYNSGIYFRNNADGSVWNQAQVAFDGGYIFGVTYSDGQLQHYTRQADMKENRLKPAGEWNVYDLRCEGSKCTLAVNGVITSTSDSVWKKGYIGLQAEGYRIEFRNLTIQELP